MSIKVYTNTNQEIELYKASYALVIGNGNYTDLSPLPGALQDVEEVKDVLETHGFDVTLKTDLNKRKFEKALAEFVFESGKDEDNRLLFYYAGHGYTQKAVNGEDLGYLAMVDAPSSATDKIGLEITSVDMSSLVTQSKKIQAHHVLFMFDSCFSGTILDVRDELQIPEGISDSIKHPVRQFITAGRGDETVPDHSYFKEVFLDLIQGRFNETFFDEYITGEGLGYYLKNQVPQYNKAQHPQYGKIQDPKLNKGDFVFVLPKANNNQDELETITTLTVTSVPNDAIVYVDNAVIGRTPMHEHQIDTGIIGEKKIVIGLELSGYKSLIKKVSVIGGKPFAWNVSLEEMLAQSNIPSTIVGKDSAEMELIPAGEFHMIGNSYADRLSMSVYVDAFYMDKYEVTNAQYKMFVDDNPEWQKDQIQEKHHNGYYLDYWYGNDYPNGEDNYPVTHVSWYSAMAYAVWAEKRLPTEAEWDRAGRGGLVDQSYPWGNAIDPSKANYDGNFNGPTPVGNYPANGYGLYDMSGNVWEWCLDAHSYDILPSGRMYTILTPISELEITTLLHDFTNIKSSLERVLRGGSWDNFAHDVRVGRRHGLEPTFTYGKLGFRCVKPIKDI